MAQPEKKFFNSGDARNLIKHYGFALFPIHGAIEGKCTCGNFPCDKDNRGAGKHPATPNGLTDATKDIEQLKKLWNSRKHLNVGIATGAVSGVFVVDIDGEPGEIDIAALGALPQTLTVKTGKGRHLYFKHPGYPIKTRTKAIGDKVDIRGDGGYVAGPGSNHASGVVYEWVNPLEEPVEAPKWLLEAIGMDKQAPPATNIGTVTQLFSSRGSWSESDVRDMLSYISADCGYDEWISIGMAIKEEGFAFHIWDDWSRSAPQRYSAGNMQTHWRSFKQGGGISFGTLVQRAKDRGWLYASTIALPATAKHATIAEISNLVTEAKPKESQFQDIKFKGLVGDTIKDIIATTQQQQPELATLNVLAALGAVFGRRFKSPMNTRTNLYTVGIASTGSGKDHSRKYIKELMLKANLGTFLGSDSLVSGAGLIAAVAKHPAQVMMLDEFGMLLQAVRDKDTGSHLKICAKILTEFYSASNSTYYGGQYADKSVEPTKIIAPNLCIYGSSTMSKYAESLDKSVIESGELNRYIIIKPERDFPELVRPPKRTWPSEDITGAWAALAPLLGANNPDDSAAPIEVRWDWQEDKIWELQKLQSKMVRDPYIGALWARYAENIIKVSMIMAIARSQVRPVIEAEDVDCAEELVKKSVELMVTIANEQMFESEHEKQCAKMLAILRKMGGIKVSKTDVGQAMRSVDTRGRNAILESLEDRGLVIIEKAKMPNGKDAFFITLK